MKKLKIGLRKGKLESLKDKLKLDISINELKDMLNYINKRRKLLYVIGKL